MVPNRSSLAGVNSDGLQIPAVRGGDRDPGGQLRLAPAPGGGASLRIASPVVHAS
jgi:hypothetical protein